jgi:hypothetical protein
MICWGLGAFGLGLTGVLTLTSGAPVLPDAAVDLFGFSTASALGDGDVMPGQLAEALQRADGVVIVVEDGNLHPFPISGGPR